MWQQVAAVGIVIAMVLQRSPGPAGRLAGRLAKAPAPAGASCRACPASALHQAPKSPR
jgi:hypothetical protein